MEIYEIQATWMSGVEHGVVLSVCVIISFFIFKLWRSALNEKRIDLISYYMKLRFRSVYISFSYLFGSIIFIILSEVFTVASFYVPQMEVFSNLSKTLGYFVLLVSIIVLYRTLTRRNR